MSKYDAELDFWKREKAQYVRWFNGGFRTGEMYGIKCPTESQKIRRHGDEFLDALETWVNADKWRYCRHLLIPPTYWGSLRVAEVGPGPLGLGRWFVGPMLVGIEPLLKEYVRIGYPLSGHNIGYTCDPIEATGHVDGAFDAAFSVNAIDHVDDFAAACAELERIVKPDGEIRIEVHYHAPTVTEPHSLNDELVKSAFNRFDMRKISELPSTAFYPPGTHPKQDRFALWSNRDYVWEGALNLR